MPVCASICVVANPSQKAPYEVNATPPNRLPRLISHMPASICATPPCHKPYATMMTIADSFTRPALTMLSRVVVMPKPMSPIGAAFAIGFSDSGMSPAGRSLWPAWVS